MTLQSAQTRYDNMQPDEPVDQKYTGEVFLDKHGYCFAFESGVIVSFDKTDAEDDCTDLPMSEYDGNDAIIQQAEAIAFGRWVQEGGDDE